MDRCILKMTKIIFRDISLGYNNLTLGNLQVKITMSSIIKQFQKLVILAK